MGKLISKRVPNTLYLEGLPLPPVPVSLVSWTQQIQDIRDFEMREDDVILCAYPKTGEGYLISLHIDVFLAFLTYVLCPPYDQCLSK